MKILTDLHLHSTCSDGQYTPTELMHKVYDANIRKCALTDHDSVSGIKEARCACKNLGIEFISGIEISTKSKGIELHILGYNIDEDNPTLLERTEFFRNERDKRGKRIYEYLASLGVVLEEGSAERIANGANLGRPHFAQAMLEQGYISDIREAFDKYLATPDFEAHKFREECSWKEAIDLIHEAGGVAVLAHPGGYRKLDMESIEPIIYELIDLGIDGIECFYSKHSKEETMFYVNIADANDLIVTIGSDYHGEKVKSDIELGYTRDYLYDMERKF